MPHFDLRAHTHLLVVAGSRAYGLHTAESDIDVKGCAVPPARYFHGFLHRFEQADRADEIEVFAPDLQPHEQAIAARTKLEGSVYTLPKLCRLATDCNPHVLDALFCRDEEVRIATPLGQRLRDHRQLFLSQRARHSFGGYAAAQLKRIRTHRRWLLEPVEVKPTRADFQLPEHTLIPADQLAAAQSAVSKQLDRWDLDSTGLEKSQVVAVRAQLEQILTEMSLHTDARWSAAARHIGLDENFVSLMDRERRYRAAITEYKQFQGWKRSRNAARAALEAEHGYDTKHGAHLVRLLRMAHEVVTTGQIHVWRGDRDALELQAIRAGAWSYDQLEDWADRQEKALRGVGPGVLPAQPDREAIDRLVVELVECALG